MSASVQNNRYELSIVSLERMNDLECSFPINFDDKTLSTGDSDDDVVLLVSVTMRLFESMTFGLQRRLSIQSFLVSSWNNGLSKIAFLS